MNTEGKTILLVEDEVIICRDQADILKQEGYKVLTAYSGEAAVGKFKNGHNIDLILMDIDLGKGMDGTQASEIILRDHDIPLIFLSNHTENEVIKKTDRITSYGFVVKNSAENVLFTAIKMAFKLFLSHKENLDQAKSLIDSETRYRRLFESAQDGIFILDADSGKIDDVNPYLIDLIGYDYNELIGMYLWEISPFHDIAENKEKFLELQKQGYVHYENLPLLNKNSKIIHVEFVSNVYLVNKIKVIQCNIRNIEKRKNEEDARKIVLEGKVILLQELKHRIKNSLNIINGLIRMESSRSSDPILKDVLLKLQNRIKSISNLYELLSSLQNKQLIQLDHYIEKLIHSLITSYIIGTQRISIETHLDKIDIDVDTALPVGLILNELVTNSLKYAFPDDRTGIVRIMLECKNDTVILEVSDNGIGIPSGLSMDDSKGLGMSLVQLLSEQINGSFENIIIENGTLFRVKFPQVCPIGQIMTR